MSDTTEVKYEAIFAAMQESPEGRAQLEIATLKAVTRAQAQELEQLRSAVA